MTRFDSVKSTGASSQRTGVIKMEIVAAIFGALITRPAWFSITEAWKQTLEVTAISPALRTTALELGVVEECVQGPKARKRQAQEAESRNI